jgi:hypothetical protein
MCPLQLTREGGGGRQRLHCNAPAVDGVLTRAGDTLEWIASTGSWFAVVRPLPLLVPGGERASALPMLTYRIWDPNGTQGGTASPQ